MAGEGLASREGLTWGEAVFVAAVAAIPGIGGSLVVLLQKTMEDDRRRVADVVNAGREVVDDDARFVRRIGEDERLRDMLKEALEAGVRSSNEAKRIAMGKVLGQAVSDDAQIDDDAAMVHALASLDSPHFALMAKMGEAMTRDTLPEPYRSALVAQGVVSVSIAAMVAGNQTFIVVNEFGRRLLRWLGDASQQSRAMKSRRAGLTGVSSHLEDGRREPESRNGLGTVSEERRLK